MPRPENKEGSRPRDASAGDADLARLIPLGAIRAPTPAERAWLERLTRVVDLQGLDAHVASAEVISACSCGCPSVGLMSHGPSLRPESIARLTDGQRDDYLSSDGSFRNRQGQDIDVTLHVSTEGLIELEVWSAFHGRDAVAGHSLPMP